MSPTSYRTAPPRINTLKEKGVEVKEFKGSLIALSCKLIVREGAQRQSHSAELIAEETVEWMS
jgi:hypothetical protein